MAWAGRTRRRAIDAMSRRLRPKVAPTMEVVTQRIRDAAPMLHRYHVSRIGVFGSVARGDARPGSDVDVLVEFEDDDRVSLFDLSGLQEDLRDAIRFKVDLMITDMIHPAAYNSIMGDVRYVEFQ